MRRVSHGLREARTEVLPCQGRPCLHGRGTTRHCRPATTTRGRAPSASCWPRRCSSYGAAARRRLPRWRSTAGVSRATAYRYFPNRSTVIAAVVAESLGPARSYEPRASDGRQRVRELFSQTFPRFKEFEPHMRAALQLSLEHESLERVGLLEEERYRRGFRRGLLQRAAAPLRDRLGRRQIRQAAESAVHGLWNRTLRRAQGHLGREGSRGRGDRALDARRADRCGAARNLRQRRRHCRWYARASDDCCQEEARDLKLGLIHRPSGKLPARVPPHFFTALKAVRCRVSTAFLHYLWTPECNAFCPETCPESRRKPVARADVRRRRCLQFGSLLRCRRHGQDHARRSAL